MPEVVPGHRLRDTDRPLGLPPLPLDPGPVPDGGLPVHAKDVPPLPGHRLEDPPRRGANGNLPDALLGLRSPRNAPVEGSRDPDSVPGPVHVLHPQRHQLPPPETRQRRDEGQSAHPIEPQGFKRPLELLRLEDVYPLTQAWISHFRNPCCHGKLLVALIWKGRRRLETLAPRSQAAEAWDYTLGSHGR